MQVNSFSEINVVDDNDIAFQQVLHFAWYSDMQMGK